jgi:hypothetical protein
MSNNKHNHLFVFVKGNKGKGAFEITDSDFNQQHAASIDEGQTLPYLMDLKAIEKSLEYIKDNRGKNGIPKEPVIFIFTTFETNYKVAAKIIKPQKNEMKNFMENFIRLKKYLERKNINQHDEVKCYWIPDNFENHMEAVKKLLDGEGS